MTKAVAETFTTKDLTKAVKAALVECKNPYAQTYLRAIPLSALEYGKEGIQVQLLYCLSNMQTWRGETARQCKKVMKYFSK